MTGARYRDVLLPARTDGIGVALRRAFNPSEGVADDFTNLLEELDRRAPHSR